MMRACGCLVLAVALAACGPQPQQSAAKDSGKVGGAVASAAPGADPLPPAQPRPDNLGRSVKWMPESGRYQQMRKEAWEHRSEMTRSVHTDEQARSRNGLYSVKVVDRAMNPRSDFAQWTFELKDAKGQPVTGALVQVQGGMPEHGHGLPSEPKVRELSNGRYVVDGLEFSMSGWWEIGVYVNKNKMEDIVSLNFIQP